MKKIVLWTGFFCISLVAFGQNINNHWILENIDLDFSTNPPLADSISSKYGYGAVSDENGDLLFYIGDDYNVYNKNHQIMAGESTGNIFPPLNSYKLRNPIVILPFLSDPNRYIIYCTLEIGLTNHSETSFLGYIVINFNNNTLGEVEYVSDSGYIGLGADNSQTGLIALKNQENGGYYLLYLHSHSEGESYTLIDGTPTFNNGIYTLNIIDQSSFFPTNFIPSSIYPPYPYDFGEYRESSLKIKVSPDFSKIAGIVRTDYASVGNPTVTPTNTYKCFVVDFNEANLSFTNFESFGNETFNATTSSVSRADIEFSADSQKLYYIKNGTVYVKDLANLSSPERKLYQTNSTNYPTGFEHLQKDKYDNIWVSSSLSSDNRNKYLHKIENPNSYSLSSVNVNSIYLINNVIPDNMALPYYIPKLSLPCHNTLVITTNLNSGQSEHKQASNSITASNTINNGATAIYHAENRVVLTSGFNAKAGSTFKAYIEGCSDEFSNKAIRRIVTEEKNENLIDVSLSPNPNNGIFELNFTNTLNEDLQIEIYNINSRLIDRFTTKMNNSNTLSVQNQELKNGLYFIKIKSKTIAKTLKFIKK